MGALGTDRRSSDQIGGYALESKELHENMKDIFTELYSADVGDHIEGKNGLSYLSWTWAWAYMMKKYPGATYEVWKDPQGRPYTYDPLTGYMCYTSVTVAGVKRDMWLPVMDSANNAMMAEPYSVRRKNKNFKYAKKDPNTGQYVDRYGNIQEEYTITQVQKATMFDINKTIMRCLTKNLAMFGLGLYIYAGEDLPEDLSEDKPQEEKAQKPPTKRKNAPKSNETPTGVELFKAYVKRHKLGAESCAKICELYQIARLDDMTEEMAQHYIKCLEKKGGNINE